jgi:hypothetical protein
MTTKAARHHFPELALLGVGNLAIFDGHRFNTGSLA